MLKKLIILNGPPDTGKDTAADYLVEKYGYTKLEMKGALRRLAHAIASLAIPVHEVKDFCDMLENNRELKENFKVPQWGDRTWREFLIWLSEEVCKPIFGLDVFALAAVKAVQDSGAERVVFSDGGFQIELNTMAERLGKEVRLVRVYREGRNFNKSKDSRSYLEHPFDLRYEHVLENSYNVDALKEELDHLISLVDPEVVLRGAA